MNYFSIPGQPRKQNATSKLILDAVLKEFGVKKEQILNRERKQPYATYRQVYQYLLVMVGKINKTQVREHTGFIHSTIIHSIKSVENRIDTEKDFAEVITKLKQQLA